LAELLDVEVEKLARSGALVADCRLETQPTSRPRPRRVRIPETVESGIASVSAIPLPSSAAAVA